MNAEQRAERVRLYGERSVAEGERAYTHEDLARDYDNSCDNGSSAIRIDRVGATIDDNARLRALIKAAEKADRGDGYQWKCPWCGSVLGGDQHDVTAEPHQDDCPAFAVTGEVR